MSSKQSLINAYLKRLEDEAAAKNAASQMGNFASAGQSRIKNANSFQISGKSHVADVPVIRAAGTSLPGMSAEPLYFDQVQNTSAEQNKTAVVQHEGRVVRDEEYAKQSSAQKESVKQAESAKSSKKSYDDLKTESEKKKQTAADASKTLRSAFSANTFSPMQSGSASAKQNERLIENALMRAAESREAENALAAAQPEEYARLRQEGSAKSYKEAKRNFDVARAADTVANPTGGTRSYNKLAVRQGKENDILKQARAEYEAWLPENDPLVVLSGTQVAPASSYDKGSVAAGMAEKENPLNQTAKDWISGGGMGQASAAAEKQQILDALTDDQKAYINYLYGTYDAEMAGQLTDTLLQNIQNEMILADDSAGQMVQNAFSAVGGGAFSAPQYVADMAANAVQNARYGTDRAVPAYTPGSNAMSENAARQQALVESAETPAGQFAVQTGVSVGNNIVNTLLFGQYAPAVMALQSAASSGYEAAQNGATGSQQAGKAVQGGITEYLTEKISWGKLEDVLNGSVGNGKQLIAQVAAQMATEAGEETVNEAANMLYDWIAMGDAGDLKKVFDSYKNASGDHGEAVKQTAVEILRRLGSAALGGAVSGGILGAGASVLNRISSNNTHQNGAQMEEVSTPSESVPTQNNPKIRSTEKAELPMLTAENVSPDKTGELPMLTAENQKKAVAKDAVGNRANAFEASNTDPESVSAEKAAYKYVDAESKQKSTQSVLDDLTDTELAEADMAFPGQADIHQRVSVKENDEIAAQRVEADINGEKEDLKKKDAWNAKDVATAQAILNKLRDQWRGTPNGNARDEARSEFNQWYDVVLEHKTTTAQALRQMQEYVSQIAADDPEIARNIIDKELEKVNAKGRAEFKKWYDIELTAEEINRINNLEPGDQQEFNDLLQDIGKRIQKEYPAKIWEKITEFTKVNMLLNVRTLLRNFLANIPLQGLSRVSDKVSAVWQNAVHAFDKDFEPTQAVFVSKESKNMAKQVWNKVGNIIAEQGSKYDRNKKENERISLLSFSNRKEVFKKHKQLPVLGDLYEKAASATASNLNKLSSRAVGAELFSEMSDEKAAMENLRQLAYGLLEFGDRKFVQSSFTNRLASYIEAKGITNVESIPDDAYQMALEAALMDTFKDDNRISDLAVKLKEALNHVGAGELLMPFVKTPANVTMRTIEYSPIGLVVQSVKTLPEGINVKKKNGITTPQQLSHTIDMASKGLTGTAMMALGVLMAHLGMITGGKPDDDDEAAFLEQAGWKPFSFTVGNGTYFSFDWAQPAAMTLVLGANIYDSWRKGEGKGFLECLKNCAVVYFDTIFEQSTMQSLADLFGGYGTVGENVLDTVMNYPLRFISSGLYAATKSSDNIVRETYEKGGLEASAKTLINKMYAHIPGLSKTLPAKYDIWGNVVKRDKTYGGAFVNAYFNPGTVSSYKDSAANNEILRLYEATKNSAVFPMKADRTVTVDSNGTRQKIDLTNEQYSEISKETGTAAKNLMDAAMKSSHYRNLSDDAKVNFLADMWSLAKTVGKVNTLGSDTVTIPGAANNPAYDVYVRDGASGVMRYYEIKSTADSDESKSVSQGELLVYLNKKNWTSEEKGNWLNTFVTSPKSGVQKVADTYGEKALASWYDYYSVLYNDALAYKEKHGNQNVSMGTTAQRPLARKTLEEMDIPQDQKAFYWDLISQNDSWQNRNPFD